MPTTTRQLSKIANVSEQTVRNWSKDYGELLSPQARGDAGPRLFSDEDVQVFCTVASLRKENVPATEVIERIRRGDIIVDHTTPQQATPNAPQTPQTGHDGPQALLLLRGDLQRQINELRLAQRAQLRRQLWSHGVAFYAGMVTMGILFYVAWWLVNGL